MHMVVKAAAGACTLSNVHQCISAQKEQFYEYDKSRLFAS